MGRRNICEKCQYTWYPKGHDVSLKCPSCGSSQVKVLASSAPLAGCVVFVVAGVLIAVYGADYLKANKGRIVDGLKSYAPKNDASPSTFEKQTPPTPTNQATKVPLDSSRLKPAESPVEVPVQKPTESPKVDAFSINTPTAETKDIKAVAEQGGKERREAAANQLLNLGRNYELNKMRDFASTKYKEILLHYPDTDAASEAKSHLEFIELLKKDK